jgi:hypothetical protein
MGEASRHENGFKGGPCQVAQGQPRPKEEDQIYGQRLAEMAKKHSCEGF